MGNLNIKRLIKEYETKYKNIGFYCHLDFTDQNEKSDRIRRTLRIIDSAQDAYTPEYVRIKIDAAILAITKALESFNPDVNNDYSKAAIWETIRQKLHEKLNKTSDAYFNRGFFSNAEIAERLIVTSIRFLNKYGITINE